MGPAELLIIGVVLAVMAAIVIAVVAIVVSRSRHREQATRGQSSRSRQPGNAGDHRER